MRKRRIFSCVIVIVVLLCSYMTKVTLNANEEATMTELDGETAEIKTPEVMAAAVVETEMTETWMLETEFPEPETVQTETECEETELPETDRLEMEPPETDRMETEAVETESEESEPETESEAVQSNPVSAISRQARGSLDAAFWMTGLVLKVNGTQVYDMDSPSGTPQQITLSQNASITFDIEWTQVIPTQIAAVTGGTVTFEICEIEMSNTVSFGTLSVKKNLNIVDENGNTITLAEGRLYTEQNGSSYKLKYEITFTEEASKRSNISGTAGGTIQLKYSQAGDNATVNVGGDGAAQIEWPYNPAPTGIPGGLINEVFVGDSKKEYTTAFDIVDFSGEGDKLVWKIYFNEYLPYQFTDKQFSQYTILEEILDDHMSFQTKQNADGSLNERYPEAVDVRFIIPVYLYNTEKKQAVESEFDYKNVYEYSTMYNEDPSVMIEWDLGSEKAGQYIDANTQADAEAYVRSHPQTWTIITENGENGKPRERLVANIGSPGNGGWTYKDVLGESGLNDLVKRLRAEAAKLTGTEVNAQGVNMKQLYLNSASYYENQNPYIYAWSAWIYTRVDASTMTDQDNNKVKNSFKVTGEHGEVSGSADASGAWYASISGEKMTAGIHICKVDSLYEYENSDIENNVGVSGQWPLKGALGGVSFEMVGYSGGPGGTIYFRKVNGVYVYDGTTSAANNSQIITSNTETGEIRITGLPVGEYYLVEKVPPSGYYPPKAGDIPADYYIKVEAGGPKVIYQVIDNDTRGVELIKIDAETAEELSGAKFKLYQRGSSTPYTGFTKTTIKGLDYYIYDSVGSDELVTGTDGKLRIIRLPAGKYYLKESAAPKGYFITDEQINFTLEQNTPDDGTHIISVGNVENYPAVKLDVDKVWSETWESEIESVKVRLNGGEGLVDDAIRNVDLNETNGWKYTYEGLPKLDENDSNITYSIEEISIKYSDERGTVLLADSDYESEVVCSQDENGDWTATVTNTKINEKFDLNVEKFWQDAAGNILDPSLEQIASVEVKLTAKVGETIYNHGKSDLILTKEGGWKGTFSDLPAKDDDGNDITYSVSEVKINYAGDIEKDQEIQFEVSTDKTDIIYQGENVDVKITNTALGKITVNKKDQDESAVSEVEFRLDKLDENDTPITEAGKWPKEGATGTNGQLIFDGLEAGKYLLTETKTKEGLQLLAKPIEITIPYESDGTDNAASTGMSMDGENKTFYYHLTYTIQNNQVLEIPSSGGIGGWTYRLAGMLCIIAGAVGAVIYRSARKQVMKKKISMILDQI